MISPTLNYSSLLKDAQAISFSQHCTVIRRIFSAETLPAMAAGQITADKIPLARNPSNSTGTGFGRERLPVATR